jgi:hypothetical protein
MNGGTSSVPEPGHAQALGQGHAQPSQTSPSGGGFVAVNARQHHTSNGHGHGHGHSHGHGTSSSTRHELLSKFHTLSERRPSSQPPHSSAEARRPSLSGHGVSHPSTPVPHAVRAPSKPAEALQGAPPNAARPSHLLSESELHSVMNSPVPIPNTPSSLLLASSQRASQQPEKDDGGPFKVEMVHRMESLAKGDRIIPPCDRCRRLHMDCLKNLTACMGCTKKHAKCSWKEVREGELRGGFTYPPGTTSNGQSETSDHESHDRASTASPAMLSPPRHGLTPSHVSTSTGQHTPQHHSSHHLQSEQQPQQPSHHDSQHDSRIPSTRNSPPERERERDRNVETQLQEAAQSSLAHANARLGNSEGKNTEYPNQTMVA